MIRVSLANHSDADFQLLNKTEYTFTSQSDLIEVAAHDTLEFTVRRAKKANKLTLEFYVQNALIAPKQHPSIQFTAQLAD